MEGCTPSTTRHLVGCGPRGDATPREAGELSVSLWSATWLSYHTMPALQGFLPE